MVVAVGSFLKQHYNAWNRLVEVRAADDTTVVAQYEYDGQNYRVVKKTYAGGVLDETRHFYYNQQWQCLEERVEESGEIADDPHTQYVWGLRYIDDLILRDRVADDASSSSDSSSSGSDSSSSSGSSSSSSSGGHVLERLYALQDANWNVVALADETGTIVERFIYDAYGRVTELNENFTTYTGADNAWEYLFTGRRQDQETGLMYYRNRYYDTRLGRFVTRDPVGYSDDVNLYRYVQNLPITMVDPAGLFTITCHCTKTEYAGGLGGGPPIDTFWDKIVANTWCGDRNGMNCCKAACGLDGGFVDDWNITGTASDKPSISLAMLEVFKCEAKCELEEHGCPVELIAGAAAGASTGWITHREIPKNPGEKWFPNQKDVTTKFSRQIEKLSRRGKGKTAAVLRRYATKVSRMPVRTLAGQTTLGIAVVELGIAIKCAYKCWPT